MLRFRFSSCRGYRRRSANTQYFTHQSSSIRCYPRRSTCTHAQVHRQT